jgi:hypothetical protein
MNESDEKEEHGLAEKISGFGQKILGEIETIGGVLTGDPITPAKITEPAVGASTCASGNQICTGSIGIFTAKDEKKANHKII